MKKEDFIQCATSIVDQYMEGSCDLSDGVLKVAQARGLSTQQIQLLSNFTNTIAHTQSWRKLADASAPDRYVAFTPVDPDVIIKLAGQPARDGGAVNASSPSAVRGGLLKEASASGPAVRNVFTPGIVPDQRWERVQQRAQMEKAAAELVGSEVFSTDALPRKMTAREARVELEKLAGRLEDEISVSFAAYDLEVCKVGQYLKSLDESELPERLRDIYAVDPTNAEKIATILAHTSGTPVRPYAVYNPKAALELHEQNVKTAAWHLPLSELPIQGNVKTALEHLNALQDLGTAYNFLREQLQ